MKRNLLIFLIPFFLFNCTNKSKNETVEYYKNQTKLKKTLHFDDFDSVYYYYKNGNLFKKGKQLNEKQKFGKWELYDKNKNLREIREWFPFKGNSRINRVWHLDKKGDTLAWRYQDSIFEQKEFFNDTVDIRYTTYDVIYFNRDTLKLNEPLNGYVEVFTHLIDNHPSNVRLLLARDENNFNYDFSNENKVVLDTFYDLSIDTINQKWFKGAIHRDLIAFGQWYNSTGKKTMRGYYQQYFMGPTELDENGMKTDSIIAPKVFFEHSFVVIDSL